jgi:sulfate adenylyltransferase
MVDVDAGIRTEETALLEPIAPHGGRLVRRLVVGEEARSLAEQAQDRPRLILSPRQLSDLELLAVGGLSPLEGFMGRADYRTVVHEMHLADGLPWTLPITLAIDDETASHCPVNGSIALADRDGPLALLEVADRYSYDKRLEAKLVYATDDDAHPGVAALYRQGDVLLAGKVTVFRLPACDVPPNLRLTPTDTRRAFAERGWTRVVGFQTRNPIHRAHEYLQKCALEVADGLLIHPLVGETKGDDVPSDVRLRCYHVLIDCYFPRDRVILSALPAAMRYAGPREAIFHALVRKNYGCTHFIVGRDHAGVGSYYGSYDAQRIFDEFDPEGLGIAPLFFDHAFYCTSCRGMATAKTCPHGETERVSLSGTKLREMLSRGETPPQEFTRPEVAEILLSARS